MRISKGNGKVVLMKDLFKKYSGNNSSISIIKINIEDEYEHLCNQLNQENS